MKSENASLDKSPRRIPAPPAGRRWLALSSLTLVGLSALFVASALWPGARFSLRVGAPKDLGSLAETQLENAPEWVTGSGTPSSNALSFRRRGNRESSRLAQIKERPEIWVVLPVPAVAEGNYVPPRRFTGRLIDLEEAGIQQRPIAKIIEQSGRIPPGKFLLFHGQTPRTERISLGAFVLLSALGIASLGFALRLRRQFPN